MKIRIVDQFDYMRYFTRNPREEPLDVEPGIRLYKIEDSIRNVKIPTPLFRPTFHCIVLVTKGYVKLHADKSAIKIGTNSAFISRAGHISATLGFSNNVQGYFIVYEDAVLHSFPSQHEFYHASLTPIKLSDNFYKWLVQATDLLHTEINQKQPSSETIFTLFQAICYKLFSANDTTQLANDKSTVFTFAFRELLHTHHIHEKLLGFYADKLNISENYLGRCVKECTGKNPKTLLQEADIEYAKMLLQQPQTDIAHIAFSIGFNDASYFSRLFRKITGISPSQYRNKVIA